MCWLAISPGIFLAVFVLQSSLAGAQSSKCYNDCQIDDYFGTSFVCGSDGITYSSYSALNHSACGSKKDLFFAHLYNCLEESCMQACPIGGTTDVCGTNGETYPSRCDLENAGCEQGEAIYVLHNGACTDCNFSCTATEDMCGSDGVLYDSECSMMKASCMSGESILPVSLGQCVLPLTSETDYSNCPARTSSQHVCGSDGVTYENDCMLIETGKSTGVHGVFQGKCIGNTCANPNCIATSTVCGTDGITYDAPCFITNASCNSPYPINLRHYGACDDCSLYECTEPPTPTPGAICGCDGNTYPTWGCMYHSACTTGVPLRLMHLGECVEENKGMKCNHPCDKKVKLVCGDNGETYRNRCFLNRASCRNPKIRVACEGECPCLGEEAV